MTNTPMTLDEMRFQFEKANQVQIHERAPEGYYRFATLQSKWIDWQKACQASQAQQASVIAELVEALEDAHESLLRFTSDEGSTQKDFDTCDHVHSVLAKVKGK